MSYGCALGCGRCCDPVELPDGTWLMFKFWAPDGPWRELPDPAIDYGPWAEMFGDDIREKVIAMWNDPADDVRVNAAFAVTNWHPRPTTAGKLLVARLVGLSSPTYIDCDAFDHDTRLCTAHTDRPPICSGFPWYGLDPATAVREMTRPVPYARAHGTVGGGSVGCSFITDLPADLTPPHTRPLIPLHVITKEPHHGH